LDTLLAAHEPPKRTGAPGEHKGALVCCVRRLRLQCARAAHSWQFLAQKRDSRQPRILIRVGNPCATRVRRLWVLNRHPPSPTRTAWSGI